MCPENASAIAPFLADAELDRSGRGSLSAMRRSSTTQRDARREAIVAAASEVMRSQGVAACTARAIADASPLTKSALHYYFHDIDEVVHLAFASLMGQFIDRIEKAARSSESPGDALWAAALTYLRLGTDRPGGARVPLLWFEYQVTTARHGETTGASELTERTLRLFTDLTAATEVDAAAARASALFSGLIGTIVRNAMDPQPPEGTLAALFESLGLPAPTSRCSDSATQQRSQEVPLRGAAG